MLYITKLFLSVVNYIVFFIYNVVGLILGRGWRLADEYLDTRRIEVIRPDDLLVLTFDFTGLQIKKSGKELWLVASSGGDGYLSVIFPPQSVGERAFLEADDNFPLVDDTGAVVLSAEDNKERPVAARLSADSRLTFVVPADSSSIPYTLEGLLKACRELKMSLSPIARGKKSEITNPAFEPEPVTAIEAPYRLILSPNNWARWQHELKPVTSVASTEHRRRDFGVVRRLHVTFGDLLLPGNQLRSFESADTAATEYTELWHTQLVLDTPNRRRESGSTQQHFERRTEDKAQSIVFQPDTELRLRAIWSPDYVPGEDAAPNSQNPFRMSLDTRDRHDIVRLTSDSSLHIDGAPVPSVPIIADRFMLIRNGPSMNHSSSSLSKGRTGVPQSALNRAGMPTNAF